MKRQLLNVNAENSKMAMSSGPDILPILKVQVSNNEDAMEVDDEENAGSKSQAPNLEDSELEEGEISDDEPPVPAVTKPQRHGIPDFLPVSSNNIF